MEITKQIILHLGCLTFEFSSTFGLSLHLFIIYYILHTCHMKQVENALKWITDGDN